MTIPAQLSFLRGGQQLSMEFTLFVISFVFFGTDLHAISERYFVQAVHQIGRFLFLFFSLQPVNVVSKPKVCDDPATKKKTTNGAQAYREVSKKIRKGMTVAKEDWIQKQCTEIEVNLSRRSRQDGLPSQER